MLSIAEYEKKVSLALDQIFWSLERDIAGS